MLNQTVLVVDDSETDLYLMRNAFKKAGSNITLQELHSGEQALAYLKGAGAYGDRAKFPLPAVMLLDLNMPKMDGFDVLHWVRGQPGLKRLAIVVLSTSTRTLDIERAFDAGANSFLVKPHSIEELIDMVRCLHGWMRYNLFPQLHVPVKSEISLH